MYPGDARGHGVDIDAAAAARYSLVRADQAVARLEGGTLFNW
jgi:mannonate dehydratase